MGALRVLTARFVAAEAFQSAQAFLLPANLVRDGFECGAEVCYLAAESGERAGLCCVGAVFGDDGAQVGVAVEGGPAKPGGVGDGGEGHLPVGLGEVGAGSFDPGEGVGVAHTAWAWAMRVSSRARRRRCRSASAIQPRASASRASVSASRR